MRQSVVRHCTVRYLALCCSEYISWHMLGNVSASKLICIFQMFDLDLNDLASGTQSAGNTQLGDGSKH